MKQGLNPEDLYKFTLVSNPRISPNARLVAFTISRPRRDTYSSSIWLSNGVEARPITSGDNDGCPAWHPSSTMIAYIRKPRKEGPSIIMNVLAEGGEPWIVAEVPYELEYLEWSPSGEYLVASGRRLPEKKYEEVDFLDVRRLPVWFNNVGWVYDRPIEIYKITYPSGGIERISPAGRDSFMPSISPDGRYIAYARSVNDMEPYINEIVLYDVETHSEKIIDRGLTISGIAWSPSGVYLAVRGHKRERGYATHHKIYIYNIETGEVEYASRGIPYNTLNTVNSDVRGPTCTRNLEWDSMGWLYFPVHERGRVSIYRVRPGGEPLPFIEAGKGVIDEFTVAGEEPIITYTYMTAITPKELYMGTRDSINKVTSFNEWISRERNLSEPQELIVEGKKGNLDAWILPPVNKNNCSKCTPWILYIHGGPKTSFGYGFMFEFHVLSSAGYAVIYSNPHGSDGYTEDFADIRGQYGVDDYLDLIDVVEHVVSSFEYLDPDRGGVAGGSYGGWMTNYMITRTNTFRAAVTMRSCSNWTSFYGASDIGWYFAEDNIGSTPWENPQIYIEKSPLFNVNKIKTPTLIIHSLKDYRCPLDQAITLYTALRVIGVETRLALFPEESHDLVRSGTPRRRIARLNIILEWFNTYLKKHD